jgi:hypothetical protein
VVAIAFLPAISTATMTDSGRHYWNGAVSRFVVDLSEVWMSGSFCQSRQRQVQSRYSDITVIMTLLVGVDIKSWLGGW